MPQTVERLVIKRSSNHLIATVEPCLSVPTIIQNDVQKFLKQVIPNC